MSVFTEFLEVYVKEWFLFGKRWILVIPVCILVLLYPILIQFVAPHDLIRNFYFVASLAILTASSIIAYVIAVNRCPSKNSFTIIIPRFNPITPEAANEAENIRHAIIDNLEQQMMEHGIKGEVKPINQILQVGSYQTRKNHAYQLGRHYAAHIVVYGEVRSEQQAFFFKPIVLSLVNHPFTLALDQQVASPANKAVPVDTPQRLEFREFKATETASLTLFVCGLLKFNTNEYEPARRIFQAIPKPTHQSLFFCGYANLQLGEFEKVLICFDKAAELK